MRITAQKGPPMNDIVTGIDHVIAAVRDLDRAVATYRRLGFTPTDRGHHPQLGTHNHLFMFGTDYFELIGVEHPGPDNQRWQTILADREGLAGIALATHDAQAARAALAGQGLNPPAVSHFARPVATVEGPAEARFAAAYVPEAITPAGPMFFCQHFTPDLVWRPEWQHHPNGVTGVIEVMALAANPAATAQAYAPLAPVEGTTVHLGHHLLHITSADAVTAWAGGIAPAPSHTMPRLAGVALRVASLAATAMHLQAASVPYALIGDAIAVGPESACGVIVKFVA
jgi:catechol 2,3-dioxygenase-like lactoylglutathione lyase family enzyme